jgi:hypothetical protein
LILRLDPPTAGGPGGPSVLLIDPGQQAALAVLHACGWLRGCAAAVVLGSSDSALEVALQNAGIGTVYAHRPATTVPAVRDGAPTAARGPIHLVVNAEGVARVE